MPPEFSYPPKPQPGDAVAVLSPSGRAAAIFPAPVDLGLTRLREDFGLRPVEYPTTRATQASPEDRAADVHAVFADPEIKVFAVTGCILPQQLLPCGGQITVDGANQQISAVY